MRRVDAWEAEDGRLFATAEEAGKHEFTLDMREYSPVTVSEMLRDPRSLASRLARLLNALPAEPDCTAVPPAPPPVAGYASPAVPGPYGMGVFKVARSIVDHDRARMSAIMRDIILDGPGVVVDAGMSYQFRGRSRHFRPIPQGQLIPFYVWSVMDDNSAVTFTEVR